MAKSKVDKAIEAAGSAQSMAELQSAVSELKPKEKNSKAVAYAVWLATERIVGLSVPPH